MTTTNGGPRMIEAGEAAPDFTLADVNGEPVTLSSLRGAPVLLVFFPGAFSEYCTPHLASLGTLEARLAADGARVIGVSVDSHHSLRAFGDSIGLRDVTLLADFHPKGAVARSYGVFSDQYGVARRVTVAIDAEGVVRSVVVNEPLAVPAEETYFRALGACAL